MSSIVLFDDKKDCCGCGACMNVCPKNAIRMAEDEVGFVYPEIDQNLCVGCGACKKACGYQTQPLMQKSEAVYAAASNNDNFLRKSASGGAFAVLAENVLKKDGVVYGAALPLENGKLEPKHLRIDTVERLPELQGSKYVQSAIGDALLHKKKSDSIYYAAGFHNNKKGYMTFSSLPIRHEEIPLEMLGQALSPEPFPLYCTRAALSDHLVPIFS